MAPPYYKQPPFTLPSRRGDAQREPDPRGVSGADEALVVRQPHVDGQGRGLHNHRQGQGPQSDQGRPHTRLPIRKCHTLYVYRVIMDHGRLLTLIWFFQSLICSLSALFCFGRCKLGRDDMANGQTGGTPEWQSTKYNPKPSRSPFSDMITNEFSPTSMS